MIKSLKMFADCVESLRTAEKKYEEEPTPFNKNIVESLQEKVDGWIVWVRRQEDSSLAKDVPPFIGKIRQQQPQSGISQDMYNRLVANHTPEEIEKYTRLMQGKL